ncbi:SGNH/GDSL hydrolase family protein [Streptomyces sp. NPDC052496]|uniref:SGNH/GDSL hydrolase family protein n=1 Tax=Streptomyces sp. NPDC052496 TaxID=3154951 RepID=UPI0034469CA4
MRVRLGGTLRTPALRPSLTLALTLALALALALVPSLALSLPFAPAAAAEAGAPVGQRAPSPPPLTAFFDNTAVSEPSDPGSADFDGAGNSLSAPDLIAAGWTPGRVLTLDAARLRWPRTAAGRPDNVRAAGQTVRLRGRGDALSLLVAATGGTVTGSGTVHYRDGTRSTYRLTAPDWRTGPLSTKAVALPHINTPGGQRAERARLYAVSVPLARGREVAAVVLPEDPGPGADLHVFAAAVRDNGAGWTGGWGASTGGYAKAGPWRDQTLRLVVRTGAGGPRVRVRLANTFASAPVSFGAASVALQGGGGGADAARKPVPLTFDGRRGIRLPAGAQAYSDPLPFTVPAGRTLLVSVHLPGTVTAAPVHRESRQVSYVSTPGSGDRTGDIGGAAYPGTLTGWPFLTGVEVAGGPGTVVALGDSITDGQGSTAGADRRWPDVLARRLQAQHRVPRYGVVNSGIAANRVVTDRYPGDGVSADTGGVSAEHRLDRDVLAQPSVRTVVVFEGINDLRAGTPAHEVLAGLRAVARRAHERGLRVVAATVAPCEGFADCTAAVDARRTALNTAIRSQVPHGTGADAVHNSDAIRDSALPLHAFDAVLDFDAVLRDPAHPQRLLPAYDSGDHLHPGDAGLRALGKSVNLRTLAPGPDRH